MKKSRVFCAGLALALSFALLPAHGAESAAPGKGAAKVVAVKGNTVTIRNESGAQRELVLSSAKGIKVGAAAGWCEEDCGHVTVAGKKQQVVQQRAARK